MDAAAADLTTDRPRTRRWTVPDGPSRSRWEGHALTADGTGGPGGDRPDADAAEGGVPGSNGPRAGERPSREEGDVAGVDAGARRRLARHRAAVGDLGMATAEYAIATIAAAGFAGLLITILRSDEVRGLLLGIVREALSV